MLPGDEKYTKALNSNEVIKDFNCNSKDNELQFPKCITHHPGFDKVCLEKWSVKLAADSYRTRRGNKYRQEGDSEER